MTQDKIQNLLKQADRKAGPPADVSISISQIRKRACRRYYLAKAASVAAAAVIIAGAAILSRTTTTPKIPHPERRIAELEGRIKYLQAKSLMTQCI